MVRRRKIGLLYQYDENWIGGTYYIQNLIFALDRLAESEKPLLIIICKDANTFLNLKNITAYPFVKYRTLVTKPSFIVRVINKLSRIVFNKNIFFVARNNKFKDLDLLFPAIEHKAFIGVKHQLYWIPDLQEHFYPNFFKKEEITYRLSFQNKIVQNKWSVLFSSKTALSHFNEAYPDNENNKFVLPFAVNLEHLVISDFAEVQNKYKIFLPYYICCNQFWQHKNHMVIFEALRLLNQNGIYIKVLFTGNENDYRDSMFFQTLKKKIAEFNLEDNIQFLGFIERSHQVCLLKNAIAVIQPSLFEGWNTTIEDAKALNIRILCSDIEVHKEQLIDYPNKAYFSPNDPVELSRLMEYYLQSSINKIFPYDYVKIQLKYTEELKNVLDSICK